MLDSLWTLARPLFIGWRLERALRRNAEAATRLDCALREMLGK